jgi:hypothetical protein
MILIFIYSKSFEKCDIKINEMKTSVVSPAVNVAGTILSVKGRGGVPWHIISRPSPEAFHARLNFNLARQIRD